jgi:hypothetical protein
MSDLCVDGPVKILYARDCGGIRKNRGDPMLQMKSPGGSRSLLL